MEDKFKYAPSSVNTTFGIIWIGIGMIFFVIMILNRFSISLITILFLINVILDVPLGIFYINLHKRDYVVISSYGIRIDKGLMNPSRVTNFNEIEIIRTIGNDIRIGLKSGKEYKIRMKNLTIQDIERINIILKEKEIN